MQFGEQEHTVTKLFPRVHHWRPFPAGFERPSAIQQRAIRPIQKGRDVIAQAQSGTGKTATFSISVLQSLDTTLRETQVLILSPTRELAVQIQKVSGSSLLDGRGARLAGDVLEASSFSGM